MLNFSKLTLPTQFELFAQGRLQDNQSYDNNSKLCTDHQLQKPKFKINLKLKFPSTAIASEISISQPAQVVLTGHSKFGTKPFSLNHSRTKVAFKCANLHNYNINTYVWNNLPYIGKSHHQEKYFSETWIWIENSDRSKYLVNHTHSSS